MPFSEPTVTGVSERILAVDGIPGVLWTPAGAAGDRPLVLLAHGTGQHKKARPMVSHAHRYVTACGFAVAAIDAPGHGDRPRTDREEQFVAGLKQRMVAGEPIGAHIAGYNAELAELAVPDWQVVLDALQNRDGVGANAPVGFWGVSLGTAIGVPLAAANPKITAAVFGLAGGDALSESAARIRVPVHFLLQWDDELVPRESGLALFDAFASRDKTLHANAGRHVGVPAFAWEGTERFFTRHLGNG